MTTSARRGSRRAAPSRWRPLVAVIVLLGLLGGCAPAEQPTAGPPDAAEQDRPGQDPPGADADDTVAERESSSPTDDGPADGAPSAAPAVPSGTDDDEDAPHDEPQADRAALRGMLEPLLATTLTELTDAELSVLVVDPQGQPLLAHDPDRPLLPASTLKLVTAAALLVTLGPDARLPTSVETTGPIDEDGIVRGNLQLVGTGDPLLATPAYGRWVYPARPRTPLEALVDELEALGVRRVAGDLLGDDPGFGGSLEAEGWRGSYLQDFNARRIAGLTVDAGLETLITWPEVEDDEEADDGEPEPDREPEDEEEPDPRDRPSALDEDAEPEAVRIEQADDPAAHAAVELARLLEERGIEVDGQVGAGVVEEPVVGTLARVHSPPMQDVLRFMVQRSDNHIADTLLHVAGRVRTGEGSWERGERALRQVLAHLGVEADGLRFADGSGLSRDDRLTARSLVELDRVMVQGRHGEVWESLMAVAGEPGTLRTRLRATPAQGRLLAKTGSLRDVASLSGFVRGDDGQRHHFAVIANDATGEDRAVVRAFLDELALLLSSDLLACEPVPASGDDGPLGRPPLIIAC